MVEYETFKVKNHIFRFYSKDFNLCGSNKNDSVCNELLQRLCAENLSYSWHFSNILADLRDKAKQSGFIMV